VVEERPTPTPVGDQVLVDVEGAGVNRADLLQVAGGYDAPPGWPQDVPGLEFAGRVAATGDRVVRLAEGDAVWGIVGGGAHATQLITTEWLCSRVPDGLDLTEAGAVPEAFITSHDALRRARLRSGERVLIQGVGSGVGTAAVQIVRAVGATSVGTSRTPEKLERAKELGLDEGIVAGDDMAARIGEVDVVLELIGGSYLETDIAVCKERGRIVIVGLIAGASADLDMAAVLRKRLTVAGTVLRSRPEHEKAAAVAAFDAEVAPLFRRGALRPVVDELVPLDDVRAAYDLLATSSSFGKVVLDMGV
jgi:NADPH:quinone reductase